MSDYSSGVGLGTNSFSALTSSSLSSTTSTGQLVWNSTAGQVTWTNPANWYIASDTAISNEVPHRLSQLFYTFLFELDKNNMLANNIKGIKGKKLIFNCDFDNNNIIQPYEYIMELIEDKKKFTVKIDVSDILTISYTNFQFIEIENNLKFNGNCDFSKLKVKFKYDKILYENHKLSQKQIRTRKINKLMKNDG